MLPNKEVVLGLSIAKALCLSRDHKKDRELCERPINLICDRPRSVKVGKIEIHVPAHTNHVPSLYIRREEKQLYLTTDKMRK